jgi:putative ABC transport system permease protein
LTVEQVLAAAREWARRLGGLVRQDSNDRALEQELALHLELEEEALRAQGHSPETAARLARVRLGRPGAALEALRDQRGLPWVAALGLDVKLALRMLRKHWGLTLVGGLAMTVAIALAASVFDFLNGVSGTSVPLDEGDRLVIVQPWDQEAGQEHPSAIEDFERWRDHLRSVVDVGAFQTVQRNLATSDGSAGPVSIAEMSAAGFRVARVSPLVGRSIDVGDERPDAPPVVVIGYDVWQVRFHGDAGVVGQAVQIGGEYHTVVGVMPERFAFPLNHSFWTPLHPERLASQVHGQVGEQAPRVVVFARLAPGATLERAHAEVSAAGLLDPATVSSTGAPLRPRVVPYVYGIYGGEDLWLVHLIQVLLVLILIPPCANIAVLVYARIVSRQGEFALRSALGASQGRIVVQIFAEVLLIAVGSAVLALVIARKVVGTLQGPFAQQAFGGQPFWMDFSLSYQTILYVAGLAVVAASIAGVLPALRATGRWRQAGLQALGSRSAPRLGRVWTTLVVVQVGLSVAALPTAVEFGWWNLRPAILGPGFAADHFLTARLVLDAPPARGPDARSLAALRTELVRRVAAESGVSGVSVSTAIPSSEPFVGIEVDEGDQGPRRARAPVRLNQVDDGFFETLNVPLLTGRGFSLADFEPDRRPILVNRTFADQILGAGNPLGRRVRIIRTSEEPVVEPEPWLEVVGVTADLRSNESGVLALYRPLPLAGARGLATVGEQEVNLTIRMSSAVSSSSGTLPRSLQEIAAALDPRLRIDRLRTLEEVYEQKIVGDILGGSAIVAVMVGILLVSVAGVYTLLSFTVMQRHREIGIRSALGAQPLRLLVGAFGGVLIPVSAGAAAGGLVALALNHFLSEVFIANLGRRPLPWILPAAAIFIIVIGLLVLAGPARRAIRVPPTDALRNG